ncbi:MAG: hypothetical protein A2066_20385 [Bacteroidetes bacterium GWB2_41_8]|nr:MAG: hypothetical protein A2066_20385 [Bacteroidetes bacterium GWB2_41_8]
MILFNSLLFHVLIIHLQIQEISIEYLNPADQKQVQFFQLELQKVLRPSSSGFAYTLFEAAGADL